MVLHGKHIARGLVGLLLAAALSVAAMAAGVSVQASPEYTRLFFQFEQPAKLQLAGGGKDIILNFDQPVKQDMLALQPKLEEIANGVQQSADGKQIILNLKKNYRVRQFISGNSVGIDIMGNMAIAQATPPATEAAPATPAAKPEAPQPAKAETEPVKVITPTAPKPETPTVVKTVAPKEKPAVKVITPETLRQQLADKPAEPAKKPEPASKPVPPAPEAAKAEPAEAKVIRVAPSPILTTKKESPPSSPQQPEPIAQSANPVPVGGNLKVAAPVITTREFKEPEAPAKQEPLATDVTLPKQNTPETSAAETKTEEATAEEDEEPIIAADAPFLVGVRPTKEGTDLYFPWNERVGAAIFERGNDIWIAFSKQADANVALLRTVLPKSIIKIDQFRYRGATLLRLITDGTLHARVSQPKKSYGWRVTLSPLRGTATLDVPVSGETNENDLSYMLLAAYDVASPLRFYDPVIGDLLIVVPTNELGRGIANAKTTAELEVLATAQGIAIASQRDDLETRRDRTGVMLLGKTSLAVSMNLPVLTPGAAPVPGVSAASSVMIPYDQWFVGAEEFYSTLDIKLEALQTAKESGKPAAMLELVKIYMGQSMLPEAAGWLEILHDDYPDFYREQKLAMLSAASYLLSGRVAEATAAINAPELKDLPEAELWRQAISLVEPDPAAAQLVIQESKPVAPEAPKQPEAATAGIQDPPPAAATREAVEEEEEEEEADEKPVVATPESTGTVPQEVVDAPVAEKAVTADPDAQPAAAAPAATPAPAQATAAAAPPIERKFDFLKFEKAYIRFYPPRMRQKLAVMAADYYLRSGSPEKAVLTFDSLNRDGILEGVQPYAEYMLGTIGVAKGKTKEALKIWDRMSRQHEDPYIRARARYSAIMLRLERGELKPMEAAEQIERVRTSWRGDGLEREMLQSLMKIYRDEKHYDATLRAMKALLQGFPGEVDTLSMVGDMSELFEDLFLRGMADDMPPLKSLGLFYEFRELTPIGEKGDEIIQKLADRLAAVDLLDRSTQLLEHQIRYRLTGENRARVGARLSLLYLLDKQPQRALEVLEITNYGNLDSQLKLQRQQLTAQSLAETGRAEEALAILTNDTSEQGGLLRLDILWGMQDWPNVINVAEDILGRRVNLTEPLSTSETPVLLKLALAYAFEEDPTQLRYLRDYYMALVPEGPYKEIFDYLTNDTTPLDAEDFQLVAKQISRTESFLDTFKNKIAQGRLSETVK